MNWKERYEQLAERERKLLLVFFGVFSLMALVMLPLGVRMGVASQAEENERIREVIQQIVDERLTLGRKQAESDRIEARYRRKAPPLASFLARTADEIGIEIPETQDRSTVPEGKSFKVRSTRISLKRVGMLALSNFMEKVENSGYPVYISRLDIKKRDKPDEFDVEMDISAYDREERKAKKASSADAEDDE